SCSSVIVARCTTSSPALPLSTTGTRGKRDFGPSHARVAAGGREPPERSGAFADASPAHNSSGHGTRLTIFRVIHRLTRQVRVRRLPGPFSHQVFPPGCEISPWLAGAGCEAGPRQ